MIKEVEITCPFYNTSCVKEKCIAYCKKHSLKDPYDYVDTTTLVEYCNAFNTQIIKRYTKE